MSVPAAGLYCPYLPDPRCLIGRPSARPRHRRGADRLRSRLFRLLFAVLAASGVMALPPAVPGAAPSGFGLLARLAAVPGKIKASLVSVFRDALDRAVCESCASGVFGGPGPASFLWFSGPGSAEENGKAGSGLRARAAR